MAKGYWLPQLDVRDVEAFKAYQQAAELAFAKFGGTLLVRPGRREVVEGKSRTRNIMREFKDYPTALACYRSPEYQRARAIRQPLADTDFLIVEGYDGPQPPRAENPPPPAARKGYWLANIEVTDPEGYKAYMVANQAPFGQFGARYLVRAGAQEITEGAMRPRTVVLEFPSFTAALACYRSPGYQAAAALRKGKGEIDLVVIEQWDGGSH